MICFDHLNLKHVYIFHGPKSAESVLVLSRFYGCPRYTEKTLGRLLPRTHPRWGLWAIMIGMVLLGSCQPQTSPDIEHGNHHPAGNANDERIDFLPALKKKTLLHGKGFFLVLGVC